MLSKPLVPSGHYTSLPIISLTSMAFLLLTQNHSEHTEYLPRLVLIIFQGPAQDISPPRTSPPLPFLKVPLAGTPINTGLLCTRWRWVTWLHLCESHLWQLMGAGEWVFSRPSGESPTTLPTSLNTKYYVCSCFSSLGWTLKNIRMYFYVNFIFKHISLQSHN